jgi:gas vesicle protein
MLKKTAVSMMAFVVCLGIFSAAAVSAQPTTGAARQTGMSEHHQMMADMMKDMSQEMSKMTEQMGGGEGTPEQRKQLSQRMERMSKVMHRMSGLYSRPAMKEPEMQKQMDQMRKQMGEMTHDSSMKSPAK